MGVWEQMEIGAERLMGRLFGGSRQGVRVQPIDIGRALLRTLDRSRRPSLARVYVPNAFFIRIYPSDMAGMRDMKDTLVREWKGVLQQKAERDHLSFVGSLRICFEEEPEHKPGFVSVEGVFAEDMAADRPPPQDKEGCSEHAQHKPAADSQTRIISGTACNASFDAQTFQPRLVYTDPTTLAVRECALVDGLTIGRSSDSDLCLCDHQVSRLHAVIRRGEGDAWLVEDKGSKNGLKVNGQKQLQSVLAHGDKIEIGRSVLHYRGVDYAR